jgi:sugar/nucleoside kinase (ribokinase family)
MLGNCTRDTIVSAAGTRSQYGGGVTYGAYVASLMGLKTAVVARLSKRDDQVIRELAQAGIAVFPTYTRHSTRMRLYYPSSNVDERVLSMTHTAGALTADQVRDLESRIFLLNGSVRGEVNAELIQELRNKNTLLAADVQGFVRVKAPDGTLVYDAWPQKQQVLPYIDILKTDAVEARMLTGNADIKDAARVIAGWGPKEIVMTCRDGVMVFAEGEFHWAPFCPRKLAGRSGRGDSCIAAYIAKRLTASPQEATVWAAAVTSLKLETDGPIKARIGDVEELVGRIYGGSGVRP